MTTATAQSIQSSIITPTTFKSIIETALTHSNKLTETDLARLSGFNDDEINMLTLYWQPCFNNSWIYLSDELILENLTNETKKQAITNFYERILIPTYEEVIDYQQVLADNELVKFHYSLKSNEELKAKPGNRKKYYIVTGEAYKCMLMASRAKKGKETRKYYIKVEKLAMAMKDYMFEYVKREQDKIIALKLVNKQNIIESVVAEKHALLSSFQHLSQRHDSLRKNRSYHKFKKGNCCYIVSDPWREKEYFKIGETHDINDRLQQYRTPIPECRIEFLVYLSDNKTLEKCMKLRHNENLILRNHEYTFNVPLKEIIKSYKTLIKYLKLDVTYETELEDYNKPYETGPKLLFIDDDEKKEEVEDLEEEVKKEVVEIVKEEVDFKCEFCDKIYKLKGNLNNHLLKIHNQGDMIEDDKTCKTCKKVFADKGKMLRHIQSVHKKTTKVTCKECDKEFSTADTLSNHIKNVHKKSTSSPCTFCDKVLTTPGNLAKHIADIHEKSSRVTCDVCNKEYTNENNLREHIKNVHNREKKTQCVICKGVYVSDSGLKYHMFIKHKM